LIRWLAHDAAQRLYDSRALAGGDSYVWSRADVVDYIYNVVIPVGRSKPRRDASRPSHNPGNYRCERLCGHPVVESFPRFRTTLEGFITEDEYANGYDKEHCKIGRQRWSPGVNAWG